MVLVAQCHMPAYRRRALLVGLKAPKLLDYPTHERKKDTWNHTSLHSYVDRKQVGLERR
jgi:hypothetical protein